LALLVLLIGLMVLGVWGLTRARTPALILEGELHHLWAGVVTSYCDLRVQTFPNTFGKGEPVTSQWFHGLPIADGVFKASLPHSLVQPDARWVELALRCSALDDTLVVLTPRVTLDPRAADIAAMPPSAFLCAAPDGQAHGELALRSAQFTLYAAFRRSH
jgi:hypothetical protein